MGWAAYGIGVTITETPTYRWEGPLMACYLKKHGVRDTHKRTLILTASEAYTAVPSTAPNWDRSGSMSPLPYMEPSPDPCLAIPIDLDAPHRVVQGRSHNTAIAIT